MKVLTNKAKIEEEIKKNIEVDTIYEQQRKKLRKDLDNLNNSNFEKRKLLNKMNQELK